MPVYARHHTCHSCYVAREEEFEQRRIEYRRSKGLPDHQVPLTTLEFATLMGTFFALMAAGIILLVCLHKILK